MTHRRLIKRKKKTEAKLSIQLNINKNYYYRRLHFTLGTTSLKIHGLVLGLGLGLGWVWVKVVPKVKWLPIGYDNVLIK